MGTPMINVQSGSMPRRSFWRLAYARPAGWQAGHQHMTSGSVSGPRPAGLRTLPSGLNQPHGSLSLKEDNHRGLQAPGTSSLQQGTRVSQKGVTIRAILALRELPETQLSLDRGVRTTWEQVLENPGSPSQGESPPTCGKCWKILGWNQVPQVLTCNRIGSWIGQLEISFPQKNQLLP